MRIILLFLAIIIMSIACKKDKEPGKRNETLEGYWMKTATLVSPGPVGQWEKYTGDDAYLLFMDSGKIKSEGAPVIDAKYNRYLLNGDFITFYKDASTDSLQMRYNIEDDYLVINPPCIEPCGIKLRRVRFIL